MSLSNQFYNAMQHAIAYGESKRSYRAQIDNSKVDKIFSHQSYSSIEATAKDFTNFLKAEHISRADQVRPEHINAFLELKARTCNNNSLVKIKTHIESLGAFCAKRYKSVNSENFSPTIKVTSDKANNVKFNNPMTKEQYKTLLNNLENGTKSDKRDARALRVIAGTGMRADEVCKQKVADCHIDARGRFGYGYITVTDPKHGRSRDVHIVSREGREAVKNAIENAVDGRLFNIQAKTLENRVANSTQGIDGYKMKGCHSVRKLFAQECYDFFRLRHTKKETIQFTNEQLGHSANRDVSELRTYVGNIH